MIRETVMIPETFFEMVQHYGTLALNSCGFVCPMMMLECPGFVEKIKKLYGDQMFIQSATTPKQFHSQVLEVSDIPAFIEWCDNSGIIVANGWVVLSEVLNIKDAYTILVEGGQPYSSEAFIESYNPVGDDTIIPAPQRVMEYASHVTNRFPLGISTYFLHVAILDNEMIYIIGVNVLDECMDSINRMVQFYNKPLENITREEIAVWFNKEEEK